MRVRRRLRFVPRGQRPGVLKSCLGSDLLYYPQNQRVIIRNKRLHDGEETVVYCGVVQIPNADVTRVEARSTTSESVGRLYIMAQEVPVSTGMTPEMKASSEFSAKWLLKLIRLRVGGRSRRQEYETSSSVRGSHVSR